VQPALPCAKRTPTAAENKADVRVSVPAQARKKKPARITRIQRFVSYDFAPMILPSSACPNPRKGKIMGAK
jgi:hypothetical protein